LMIYIFKKNKNDYKSKLNKKRMIQNLFRI